MFEHFYWPKPGSYLVAVSGGIDSMVLLDILANARTERGYHLTVGHLDHGMRTQSGSDRQFVEAAAGKYGLAFESHAAKLGAVSEASARAARYEWLSQTARRHHATLVTAHHADDLIETSLLNLARGTSRLGLAPMQDRPPVRPLLATSRVQIQDYATAHHIQWREDHTNADTTNPRNWLRHTLLPRATPEWRAQYLTLIKKIAQTNQDITSLTPTSESSNSHLSWSKQAIQSLSLAELAEVVAVAARMLEPSVELNARLLDELALFIKTASPGRERPLTSALVVRITQLGVELKRIKKGS